jgi:hypothetical protein
MDEPRRFSDDPRTAWNADPETHPHPYCIDCCSSKCEHCGTCPRCGQTRILSFGFCMVCVHPVWDQWDAAGNPLKGDYDAMKRWWLDNCTTEAVT